MTTPDWLKPGVYGALCGAIVVTIIGFSWGGWMTGSSAAKFADDRSDAAVMAALVPVCVDRSTRDPDRAEKLATIQDASSYQKREAVMDTGCATLPGMNEADRDLAQACIDGLGPDAT